MLIVVSDFHLSEGWRPAGRKLSPAEDFFFDDEFSRFLTYLKTAEPGRIHLIINGDLFDFLQVGVDRTDLESNEHLRGLSEKDRRYIDRYGAKTDEPSSIFKLDKIHQGHPVFFQALSGFLAQGNRLTVITGNHDIDLYWPGVQARLKDMVSVPEPALARDGGIAAVDIEFQPWIYYDRDHSVYIEHGNQYESLNSFRYPLRPVLPKNEAELNLPFGSLFVRYLLTQVEKINPFADNIKPNTKYVAWAIKTDPLGFRRLLKLVWRFAVTVGKIYRRSGNQSRYSVEAVQEFDGDTNRSVMRIAKRFGIAGDVNDNGHPLRQIMRLHQRPFNDGKLRFMWQLFFAGLDIWLFLLSGLASVAFVVLVWKYGFRNVYSTGSLAAAAVGALAGQAYFQAGVNMDKGSVAAAKKIGEIMKASGNPARYIVFGHTHQPEIIPLDDEMIYFNTGTWDVIFEDQEELIREKRQFAFLMFERPGAEPRLMRWNDAVGAPELLPLFDAR